MYIVAIVALLLSGYAIWATSKFNKRQLLLIDSQERLNKRLLEQNEIEALEARKADVIAEFVKLGKNNYRLRICNKGKASARNVLIEFPEGNDAVPKSEIAEKLPMEILEQNQSVELIAAPHHGTPLKQTAILSWRDDYAADNVETVYLTI